MYRYREFTAAGGVVNYAGSITDAYHVAGLYNGRILKGRQARRSASSTGHQNRTAVQFQDRQDT
jgi:hypothetical protein